MELDIESLKESNDFLNDLYRDVTTAIFLADGEARVRNFNDSFAALFLPDERAALGELCGNAIGCSFVLDEGRDCGGTSNCESCRLRRDIITSFTERVPVYRDSLSRDFVLGGRRIRKHFRFTTKYESYRGHEYVLVLVDDVSELVDARAELEGRNALLSGRNAELEELLRREAGSLVDNAREIERLGLEREALAREVRHRVGNNLQVISSLVNLGRAPGAAAEGASRDSSDRLLNRITSVIEVYRNAAYETGGPVVRLPSLARSLVAGDAARSPESPRELELAIGLELAGFDSALPIGILLGDFLFACRAAASGRASGLAYGAPERARLSISGRGALGRCELSASWPELGREAAGASPLNEADFGVASLVARQCGGELSCESSAAAFRIVYEFPL